MALRSIWKGVISFGMVAIPCQLYNTIDEKKISFHQVHGECGSRIQMPRFCPVCQKRVELAEIKRAYEYAKGQHIILEEIDFVSLPLKTLKAIEIVEFSQIGQIDPRSYERSFFVSPEEVGIKSFTLLREAMEKTGLVAIAKLTFREKEHLSVLRPFDNLLLLQTLYYPDELRDHKDLKPARAKISQKEISLAVELINCLKTKKLRLARYRDEYRKALVEVIEAKLAGQAISPPEIKVPEVVGLAEALLASIEAKRKSKAK